MEVSRSGMALPLDGRLAERVKRLQQESASLRSGVPAAALTDLRRLGRTLKRRAADMLALLRTGPDYTLHCEEPLSLGLRLC